MKNLNKEKILKTLSSVFDPEINVNIVDLGLIYEVKILKNEIIILMTLTTPTCPFGEFLVNQVESALLLLEGVKNVKVEITFDPPWEISKLSENAKDELGIL